MHPVLFWAAVIANGLLLSIVAVAVRGALSRDVPRSELGYWGLVAFVVTVALLNLAAIFSARRKIKRVDAEQLAEPEVVKNGEGGPCA